jgi:hypothetical protein
MIVAALPWIGSMMIAAMSIPRPSMNFRISVSDFSRARSRRVRARFRARKIDRRIRNPWPVEFGKQIGLTADPYW